jgi:hypothetical protein
MKESGQLVFNRETVSAWDIDNVLAIGSGDGCTIMNELNITKSTLKMVKMVIIMFYVYSSTLKIVS